MINSILIQPLRNGEYLQFLTDTLNIVAKNNPDQLKVQAQYNQLYKLRDDIEILFKVSQGSLVTQEIEAMDKRRDQAITGLTLLVQAFSYSTDTSISRYAKTLSAHLALFGTGIAKDNYQSETTSIRNIVNDWASKPELQEAVLKLNLLNWQNELEQANNEFNVAYTKRNEELASAPSDKLRALRLQGNEAYYKLRTRLNSNFDINDGAEPWSTTINLMNQTIGNYVALLARRGSDIGNTPVEQPEG